MNYNKVILSGNLTRDVELRQTSTQTSVCSLGLATHRVYLDAAGEKQQETTFVEAEAFGRTAENISKFFYKGRPIFVEGRLRFDQWTNAEGSKRTKLKVVVEKFEFVGPPPNAERDTNSAPAA